MPKKPAPINKRPNKANVTQGLRMSDVARIAGVATSTISRALTNPGRVSEKTHRRIAAVVEQLGYTPNTAGHILRGGKSNIVMVILPGPPLSGASQVIAEVVRSVGVILVKNGLNLVIASQDGLESTTKHILDFALGGTVRGVITVSENLPTSGNRSLDDAGLPIVSLLLDQSSNSIPSVITNEREAMRDATRYLIRLGHRKFFYIAAPKNSYHEIERYSGLVEALTSARISLASAIRHENNYDFQHGLEIGVEAAGHFLSLQSPPTATLCYSDDAAIAFMSTVQKEGIMVPQQLSVVGFDGAAVGAFCSPPLTTVAQPTVALGARATETLLKLFANKKTSSPLRIVLPSRLLIRSSATAPSMRHSRRVKATR